MKKGLLLSLSLAFSVGVFAQGASRLPYGFRKAEVPASMKNRKVAVSANQPAIDNGIPNNNNSSRRLIAPQSTTVNTYLLSEYLVGFTLYDLQSNASMSHRLERRPDGAGSTKISAAWTFSPEWNINEDFLQRGTGYNYSSDDGVTWQFPFIPAVSQGPTARTEPVRTGFTNIVTTRNGSEMSIAHNGAGIAVNRRTQTGTGAWTYGTPFGTATDFWPKACADGDTVYAVWQGSGTATAVVAGQTGPIWFSYSTDAGATWMPKTLITGLDSTYYRGFGGDDYNIDARNGTVAIVAGSTLTDVVLMKSSDLGVTWTKTIVLRSPLPLFNPNDTMISDTNADGVADFIFATSGDGSVLLDNAGKAHVWFSDFAWILDSAAVAAANGTYFIAPAADGLEYWNESMPTNGYVMIAAAQDFNGDTMINFPADTFCSPIRKWGNYRGGITGMPSSGIDANGTIYVTYQTIDELTDTMNYKLIHMHVYMTTSSDGGLTWTYPYDIVPTIAEGGDGFYQEAVFASMARYVDDKVCVLYQRDAAPGTALATVGSCDDNNNSGNTSNIVFARIDALTVSTNNVNSTDLFVNQSYPNPTTGMAYVNVSIKKAGNINVIVTDMLGKIVYSDVQSNVVAGTSTIALNTAKWNAGIYNYTITSGSQKVSKKMIVQ